MHVSLGTQVTNTNTSGGDPRARTAGSISAPARRPRHGYTPPTSKQHSAIETVPADTPTMTSVSTVADTSRYQPPTSRSQSSTSRPTVNTAVQVCPTRDSAVATAASERNRSHPTTPGPFSGKLSHTTQMGPPTSDLPLHLTLLPLLPV